MIRKISIGIDYKDAMHYTVGQRFGNMTIDAILQKKAGYYEVWIRTEKDEILLWKVIDGTPCVIEMDIKAFG